MISISDSNRMVITDDAGQEKEVEILLTFGSEELDKQYVIYRDPDDDEFVYVCSYDDEGNLEVITDEKELAMATEVWEAFENDEDDEEE